MKKKTRGGRRDGIFAVEMDVGMGMGVCLDGLVCVCAAVISGSVIWLKCLERSIGYDMAILKKVLKKDVCLKRGILEVWKRVGFMANGKWEGELVR